MLPLHRAILAAVFLVDGAIKLLQRGTAGEDLAPFGVPARYAVPVRMAQGLIEVALAAALIPLATARWGAVAALAVLLVYLVVIAVLLVGGRHPEGRFPGQERRRPIGAGTLVRCLLLTAGTAALVARGRDGMGESLVTWLRDRSAGEMALLLAVLVAVALLAVARPLLRRRSA